MTDQQENHVARRLFQTFQQGIGCGSLHIVRRVDQDHPAVRHRRRRRDQPGKTAYLIDPYVTGEIATVLFQPGQLRIIWMSSGMEQMRGWVIAGNAALLLLPGQQHQRDLPRQPGLSDSARAGQYPGMVQPARQGGIEYVPPGLLVPDDPVHGKRSEMAAAMRTPTSSGVADVSITRNRSGSACA